MKNPPPLLQLVINPENQVSETQQRLTFKTMREAGDVLLAALAYSETTDIALNADGFLWQTCLGEKPEIIGRIEKIQAEMFLRTVAAAAQTVLTPANPWFEGILHIDGSRISAQIPPVVSAPVFSIRKPASKVFTLNDYVKADILTPDHAAIIKDAVRDHKNILVSGGTGSGKTTFGNALADQIVQNDPLCRVFFIEDTAEIQCAAKNKVSYVATETFSMRQAVRSAMRGHPDRINVGEVRGPEALDLLLAWNSGHSGGFCTLHANDALGALSKLALYVSQNEDRPRPVEPLIAQAVNFVVQIAKTPQGRRVKEIIAVEGYKNGGYEFTRL